MKNYQVTAAIEEEKRLIKDITAEISRLMTLKNSKSSTVRSYRARYRYWRNNVATKRVVNSKLDNLIKRYNADLAAIGRFNKAIQKTDIAPLLASLDGLEQDLNSIKQFEIDPVNDQVTHVQANIDEIRAMISDFQRSNSISLYEDELVQAKAEYQQKMAEYEKRLEDYQNRAKEVMSVQEAVDYFNASIAHGIRILSLTSPTTLRINSDAIIDLATTLLNQYEYSEETLESEYASDSIFQYADLNWDGLQELYSDGNQATLKHELERGIEKTTNRWKRDIETEQVALIEELEASKPKKPQIKEVEKPRHQAFSIPTSLLKVGEPIENTTEMVQIAVSAEFLVEMDTYLTGPYKTTEEHTDEINALAERIGNGCPKLMFEDDRFSNTKLSRLLNDLEDNFSSFGSQRNSAKGRNAIASLKDSVEQLRQAKSYESLEDAGEQFSRSSNLMIMWLTSNWWQNGGKPEGDAHPWKGKYARRLTKPR